MKNKTYAGKLTKHYQQKQNFKNQMIVILCILTVALMAILVRADYNIASQAKVTVNIKQPTLPINKDIDVSTLSTKKQIEIIAKKENFKYTDYLLRLAYCESRFDKNAVNYNGRLLRDLGLFQINEFYHKEVTPEQAHNIEFATKWTMDKINNGKQHLWACDKIIKGKSKEQLAYNY